MDNTLWGYEVARGAPAGRARGAMPGGPAGAGSPWGRATEDVKTSIERAVAAAGHQGPGRGIKARKRRSLARPEGPAPHGGARGKGKRGSLGAGAEGEGPGKAGAGGPSSLAWEEHLQVAQLREKAKAALGKPGEARSAEELKALEWFIKQQLNTRYFQQIPPDLTKSFCQAGSLRRVASHEPIFRQGEAGAEFFIIARGVVDVYMGYRPSVASGAPSAGASDGEGLEEGGTRLTAYPVSDAALSLFAGDDEEPGQTALAGGQGPPPAGGGLRRAFGGGAPVRDEGELAQYGNKIATLSKGMAFGELELLKEGERTTSCVAIGPVEVIAFPGELHKKVSKKSDRPLILSDSIRHVLSEDAYKISDSEASMAAEVLRSIHFFSKLPKSALLGVVKSTRLINVAQNHVLFRQGDMGQEFYIILSGSVSIHLKGNQRRDMGNMSPRKNRQDRAERVEQNLEAEFGKCVSVLYPGDRFGERALLQTARREATAITCGKSEILVVHRSGFNTIVQGTSNDDTDSVVFHPERLRRLIQKPPVQRTVEDLNQLVEYTSGLHFFKELKAKKKKTATTKDAPLNMMRAARYLKVPKDSAIVQQGEEGSTFYIIISGRVSIHMKEDGEKIDENGTNITQIYGPLVGILGAGKSFGELALLGTSVKGGVRGVRSASVVAQELTELLTLEKKEYDQVVRQVQEQTIYEKIRIIKKLPGATIWPYQKLIKTAYNMRQIDVPRDIAVVEEGSEASHLYVVRTGELKICRGAPQPAGPGPGVTKFPIVRGNPGHGGTAIGILGTGEMFGDLAFLDDQPHPFSIVSNSACQLFKLEGDEIRKSFMPEMFEELKRVASMKLEHFENRYRQMLDTLETVNSKLLPRAQKPQYIQKRKLNPKTAAPREPRALSRGPAALGSRLSRASRQRALASRQLRSVSAAAPAAGRKVGPDVEVVEVTLKRGGTGHLPKLRAGGGLAAGAAARGEGGGIREEKLSPRKEAAAARRAGGPGGRERAHSRSPREVPKRSPRTGKLQPLSPKDGAGGPRRKTTYSTDQLYAGTPRNYGSTKLVYRTKDGETPICTLEYTRGQVDVYTRDFVRRHIRSGHSLAS